MRLVGHFFWEDFGPLIIFGAVVFVLLILSVPATEWAEARKCERRWAESGISSKYVDVTGCLININGRWIPDSSYKVTQ